MGTQGTWGQIKNIKLHIVTDIKVSHLVKPKKKDGQVYEIWKGGPSSWREICRSKSPYCEELRRWNTRSSLWPCPCCWNRQIPTKSYQTNGKEKDCQALQNQALPESRQLQPSDAHKIQRRCCIEQISCQQRHIERR